MCHSQHQYCSDVQVFHSAECWTDYKLVCRLRSVLKKRLSCKQKRFNVDPLKNREFVKKFVHHVTQLLKEMWDQKADGHTQWSVIRDSMVQTCNEFRRKVE